MPLLVRYFGILVIHVVGGLTGFLFAGLRASLKDCLAGVSGFKRIRCPSHESRRRSVTMLQGSHFVRSYSCWCVDILLQEHAGVVIDGKSLCCRLWS